MQDSNQTYTLYVLKLQNKRYYVGRTHQLEVRLQEHLDGRGSAWTNKYPPLEVEAVYTNADPFDEDKLVKIYMAKHGIAYVRGGSYSQVQLSHEQINLLQREIQTAQNLCYTCGDAGHYTKNCHKWQDVSDLWEESPEPPIEDNNKYRLALRNWARQRKIPKK